MDKATEKLLKSLTRLAKDIDEEDDIPEGLEPGELSWMLRESVKVITKLAENRNG